ncbi:MAG: hypothetical protein NC452_05100, partial [Eubacterium sp.]|nr:hypothetical protein [Eubacterium sp.]
GNDKDIIAIDEKYLKPLNDDMEYMQFYKRVFPNGKDFAIVCRNALELEAIIMPCLLAEDTAKELLEIGKYYTSPQYKALREKTNKVSFPPIPVDPDTGEVIEDSEYTQETF